MWEILKIAGTRPAPHRDTGPTWAAFLRSQAETILATDFVVVGLLDGSKAYVLAVIEHATRRVRILGATLHRTTEGEWNVLTEDLKAADTHRDNADRPTDWADRKRLSASAWVWAKVTSSEVRYAPAFNPAPIRSQPTSLVGATASHRYHLARRDYGHYAALRARLTGYAEALIATIDACQDTPIPVFTANQPDHRPGTPN